MADDSNSIILRASFQAIQSAITLSGDGSDVRIKLDTSGVDLLPFTHLFPCNFRR